jgi:Na+/H+ antiporter NhaD/arsenite permease-like protein
MIEMQFIALLVFIGTYILIIDERIHRTVCAMMGASILIVLGILDWKGVLNHIDFGTIFLLLGMMIIVNTARNSGLFEYIAIITAKTAKGIPIRVLILFAIVTAICSAFLDNVTTVLLITPMLLTVTRIVQQNPIPFLLTEIFASNIGGTATLIGDPPNIMIASASGLTFNEFLMHMGPIAAVNTLAMMLIILLIYGKRLTVSLDQQANITAAITSLDEKAAILDPKLFRKSVIVILGVIVLFFLHSSIGLDPAEVALIGASVLLFWSRESPILIFERIEWPALFFFGGLFVLVGGLVETGVISQLAEWLLQYVTNTGTAIFVVASFSALASGIVDNIPLTAAMIPLIKNMALSPSIDEYPLWWALSLGACLGGNMTSVGASANVVVLGILDREGHSISFVDFFKIGVIITFVTVSIGIIMLYIMFPEAAPW